MSPQAASRCLITLARAKSSGGPTVASYNSDTQAIQIIRLPRRDLVFSAVTGVAANDCFLFFAVQVSDRLRPLFYGGSFFLLVLNRQDLSFAALHPLEDFWDVHSICLHDGRLYIVSSGSDEVIALQLDGPNIAGQTVAWRPVSNAPREDRYHLNSLISWNGSLVVSAFGERAGPLWSSATNGFVHDITRDRRLLSGINQPHSLLPRGGDLLFCESRGQSVRSLYDGRRVQLTGYTRGLGVVAGRIAVGVSRGRRSSKSAGQLNNWGSPGGTGGQCGIYWLTPESLDVEGFTDLGFCSDEIYEILPIDDFGVWPVTPELEWRDATIAGFDSAIERIRLQYDEQITGYQSALDKLNIEACSKIEEANEIIRDLYRKLDEQTRWAQSALKQVEERDQTIHDVERQLELARQRTPNP